MEMQIVGRLTKDAEVNTTTSGKQVMNFDVAVNEKYKVQSTGELKSNTSYVECAMWRGINLAPYLKKGKQVLIKGDIGVRAYIYNSNQAVGKLTLRVFRVTLLDGKEGGVANNAATAPVVVMNSNASDDLPF